jgi:hypothetical protein
MAEPVSLLPENISQNISPNVPPNISRWKEFKILVPEGYYSQSSGPDQRDD